MRVRRAARTDIPAMLELGRQIPTSANWSHAHYEGFFRTTASEPSRYFVLAVEDESELGNVRKSSSASPIIAYLAAHRVDADWELQFIVVSKESQHRGVGTCLLNQFISHVRSSGGRRIFLEVRESNAAARTLYRKLGFQEVGLRRSYYTNPLEDAILCHLSF